MNHNDPSKIDQLLDLLLDALQERQAVRNQQPELPETSGNYLPETLQPQQTFDEPEFDKADIEPEIETAETDQVPSPYIPEKLPSIDLDKMLGRLVFFLLVLIILINIPFNRFGTNLARAMPDEQALVIRDGLVLKGSGDEIYVLEDNHKRWISSLDAFEYYGYRWDQVNVVNDAFLDRFPNGPALSILQKCPNSPHVFAIENGVKRWIKDIPTFVDQGYVWDDVRTVFCIALREIPTGPPIPPDAGESPIP